MIKNAKNEISSVTAASTVSQTASERGADRKKSTKISVLS
jgi:hypothetical protein